MIPPAGPSSADGRLARCEAKLAELERERNEAWVDPDTLDE